MDIKNYVLDVLFQIETMLTTGKSTGDVIEYIEQKKKDIEKLSDKAADYMDELIDNLK